MPEYDDRALFEKLILDGFQAGLAWIIILRKRDNFRKAFDDFNPEKIARYTPKKVERLMQDAGIVRNRSKIEGAIGSARAWLKIMEEGPGFSRLLWDHLDGKPRQNNFKHRGQIPAETPLSKNNFQGPRRPRLQVRRPDHRLCLHAGGRHGQRSPHDLPSPRRGGQARKAQMSKLAKDAGPRAWQRMLSGRRLDLLDPSPLDVELEDIAHGLARVARWNGQTKGDAYLFGRAAFLAGRSTGPGQGAAARRQGAARGAAARRAGIRHRRHDLAVQGGDRRQLQGGRAPPARRHPPPLRPALAAARPRCRR